MSASFSLDELGADQAGLDGIDVGPPAGRKAGRDDTGRDGTGPGRDDASRDDAGRPGGADVAGCADIFAPTFGANLQCTVPVTWTRMQP